MLKIRSSVYFKIIVNFDNSFNQNAVAFRFFSIYGSKTAPHKLFGLTLTISKVRFDR